MEVYGKTFAMSKPRSAYMSSEESDTEEAGREEAGGGIVAGQASLGRRVGALTAVTAVEFTKTLPDNYKHTRTQRVGLMNSTR